jgi:hypothetical protein
MKIELEIDDDEFDKMLCKALKTLHESICHTYKFDVLSGENARFPLFFTEPEKERQALEKFIDALALVHNYHCIYDERIGSEDTLYT